MPSTLALGIERDKSMKRVEEIMSSHFGDNYLGSNPAFTAIVTVTLGAWLKGSEPQLTHL